MSKDASIGWMYEGAKGNVHREDYLLGKKVDKNFEKYSDVVNAQKAEAIDSIVSTRTVFAPTEGSTGLKTSSLQKDIIKSEDPFVAVKVREETKRREIMDNPLMKMRLQNMLKTMMTSKGDKKKDKKSKKDKKKKKKRSRSSSDSSRESSPERSNKTSKKRSPSPKRRRRTSEKDEDTRSRRKDSRDDYKKEVVSRRRSRSESVERRQKLRSPKRDRSRSVERRRKSRSPRRSTESGRRSPKHQRSRSRSAERYRRKSRSPRRQRSRSDERRRQSPERSKKEERQKQRSRSRSAENHKSSKSKSSRQFDSHIPAHLQIQKRSSGSGSESESDHGRNSDDDRKEKKSYGLVEMRKRTAEEREETARAPSKEFKLIKLPDGRGGAKKAREPRRVLTEEEKAARLAEMQQDNVKWRDDVRASNVEQNRVEDEEEKKEADKNGYAPSFIRMYGGYSGSFNLSDYAPSDPTAEIPGLGFPPLPVPQQPQPAVQPNVAPPQASSAPSTSARHVNRSQSTNDTRSANVKNRVTTAEYRKDFAQAAPYVPTPINENAAAERAPPPQPTPLPPPPRPPNPAQNAPRATVNVKNEPPGVKTAPAGQSQGPSQAAQQQQARGNLQQGQQPQDERQRRQMEIRSLHEHLTQPGHNQQQGRNPEQVMQQQKDYREQQQIAQRQQQLAIHQQRLHIQNMMQTHGANRNSNDRPDIPVQQPPPPGGVNGNPNNQPLMPVQQQQQQQQRPAPLQPLITPEEAKNPNAVMQMLEFPSAANPMKSNHVRFKGQLFPAEFIIKLFFESNLPILDQLARLLPENHPLHPDNRRRRVELPMNQPPPGYPAPPMSAERLIQMVTNQQVSVGNQPGPSQVGQPVRPPGIIPGMPFNAPPGLMIPPNLNAEQRQQFIQNFMRNQQQFAMHQRMNPNQQSQGQRAPLRVPLQLARLTPVHPNNQLLQQLRGPPPMYNPQEHPSNMATPLQRTDQQPSQPGSSQFPHGMRPLNHAQQMMELAQRNREVQVNPLAAPPVSSFTPAPQSPEPVDVKPTIRTAQVKPNKNQKPAIVTIQDGPSKVQVKREVPDDKVSSSGDAPPTSSSGAQRAVRIKQEPIESDEGSIPRDLNPVESEIIRRQIVAKCEKQKQRELEEMERRHKEEIDRRIDARVEEMLKARLDEELKRRLPMFIDNQNAPEGLPTSSERVESVTSLATVPELGAPEVVQESQVTTSQKDANKKSRSRSDSTDSELAVRPNKKKVIKDSDSEDDEENNLLSRKPARRSATPVRKTRKVIIEDSDDDDMPMVSRKRNRRVDLDEEYRIEKEADDQGDSEMEDFINDGDVTGSEDDEEDSLKDFIADDDEDELPAPKKRSITRESRKRITRSSSRCKQTSKQTKKSSNQRVRHEPKSSEPKSSSRTPKTYEEIEAAKKSKRIKTMNTKEENRRKKHLEQLAAMENVGIERIDGHGIRTIRSSKDSDPPEGFSQLLDCFHTSNDKKNPQRVGERRRTEGSSSTNKRPSTCTKDEDDDFDGVHVPAKRMAHSSSAPKPSSFRKEVPSAAQLGRNRPNQTAMLEKRQNEADDAKIRMEEEYRKLKSKKYPTEQEQLKIRELAKKLSLAKRSVPFPSISAPSSSSVPRKITIKKEIISTPEKLRPPPKILKPHVGSIFTQHRKEAIANIFKHLLEADVADPEGDAQRYELEVAEKAKDAKNYKMSLAHKICYIKRQATSGIVPVNKNAVSHQRILGGGAKENCTVASNRRQHVRPDQLPIEELFPLLVPLKLTHSELQKNAYPLFINGSKTAEIADTAYTVNKKMFLEDYDLARVCSRCNKEFRLNPDGTMIHQKDICRYHNRGIVRDGKKQTFSKRYPCCNEEFNSAPGCKFSDVHVFDQLFKKELKKFVSTPQPSSSGDPRSVKAYALDCEFVYTVDGPALARLTMVDMKNTKVLDVFIKPPSEVLDPNTEFSGLTLEQVQNATDTMQTCHDKLFKLVNSETILIGHSLESDLKAMRIVHMSVIDTAILFSKGDFKTALRTLSSKFLHKHIQGDNEDALGHDSLEDAQACVDLIFYGLKNPESLGVRPSS